MKNESERAGLVRAVELLDEQLGHSVTAARAVAIIRAALADLGEEPLESVFGVPRLTMHDALTAFEAIRKQTLPGSAAHGIATLVVQQILSHGGDGVTAQPLGEAPRATGTADPHREHLDPGACYARYCDCPCVVCRREQTRLSGSFAAAPPVELGEAPKVMDVRFHEDGHGYLCDCSMPARHLRAPTPESTKPHPSHPSHQDETACANCGYKHLDHFGAVDRNVCPVGAISPPFGTFVPAGEPTKPKAP